LGRDLEKLTKDELVRAVESYQKTRTKFLKQVLADAEKDFDRLSRTGFGQDGSAEDLDEDFRQVRGEYDANKFVKEIHDSIEAVEHRMNEFREKISTIL